VRPVGFDYHREGHVTPPSRAAAAGDDLDPLDLFAYLLVVDRVRKVDKPVVARVRRGNPGLCSTSEKPNTAKFC
jgi:hypothetical protein